VHDGHSAQETDKKQRQGKKAQREADAKQPALESAGFPDTVQAFPQQAKVLRPRLPGRPLHHRNI
jgi:hypothetical protein